MTIIKIIVAITLLLILIIFIIAMAKDYKKVQKERQFKKEQLTAIQQDLNYLRKKIEELEKDDKK